MAAWFRRSWSRLGIADPDVGIDLGTAYTRLCARGRGIVADVPTAAPQERDGEPIPKVPLRAGVIADHEAAVSLLTTLMRKARRAGLARPRALACAPTDATEDEQSALADAARRAGASAVAIVPDPLAAAVGARLDLASPYARMLVDIGDGVTDLAVLREGRIEATWAVRTGCGDLREAVRGWVERRHDLRLAATDAERLVRKVGVSGHPLRVPPVSTGCPEQEDDRKVVLDAAEIRWAMEPIVRRMMSSVERAVRELPPRTACETIENGICLAGGGAYLPGMAERVASASGITVRVADDPLHAVIRGANSMLETAASTGLWAI